MTPRPIRRVAALLFALIAVAAACTQTKNDSKARGRSARPALAALCPQISPQPEPGPEGAVLPPAVEQVADQVEAVRGLQFKRPVSPEPVSRKRINELLRESLAEYLPADFVERESRALQLLGALPKGTDLFDAIESFHTSQVIGFYDTLTHRLVFIGTESPSPFERMTLSHELTHALQDQWFDLTRLDDLQRRCEFDEGSALSALVEGDAVETQLRWARQNLSAQEIVELQQEQSSFEPPPSDVPPFVEQELVFPYPNGHAFVQALMARGGLEAVNEAFRNPPVSTEQILHPEKYPGDEPQHVEVPDLTAKLGANWKPLDREDFGEEDAKIMLGLTLTSDRAGEAAAGWDGGQYFAWANGDATVLVLDTVWDSPKDAAEFQGAMRDFLAQRDYGVSADGKSVRVFLASDRDTLQVLEQALGLVGG